MPLIYRIRQYYQKPVVHPFENKTGKIKNMTKQAKVVEVPSIVKRDKCHSQDPIGDTSYSTLCDAD